MTVANNFSVGACVVVAGVLWASAPAARGQCDYDWLPGQGLPGVDGPVCAATTWDPDGPGPQPELLVVGGSFGAHSGALYSGIAAWDGQQWQSLGTGMDGPVYALTVYNGELIAGGQFTTAGGVACRRIARWDGQQWHSLGAGMWSREEGYPPCVYALTVYDGQLVAGGDFIILDEGDGGDVVCASIARWDGQEWQPLGTGMGIRGDYPADVYALTVYGDQLIAGGQFTTAGGIPCDNIARWDGQQWQPLGTKQEINGAVYALTVYGDQLIAGGQFTTAGGVPCNRIARWDAQQWQPLGEGMACGVDYPVVHALMVYDGQLLAGGDFSSAGGVECNYIARWDAQQWQPLGTGTDGPVYALTVYRGEVVAGGVESNYIARWNGQQWLALGAGIGDGPVEDLTVYDGELVAGGQFTTAGGVVCNHIARWDGQRWQALGAGVSGGPVYALTVYRGEVVAGGYFTTAGGVPCNRIARWDGQQWQPLGMGLDGYVYALTVYDGELVAGGQFTTGGGVVCNRIARWNGQEWEPLGAGMDNRVYALTAYQGQLVAGGQFTNAGGGTCNRIARWDGSSWAPLGSGMTGGPAVRALTVHGGQLIAGGNFTTAGGVVCNSIARWDAQQWQPMGTGVGGPPVWALTVYAGQLVAGGYFTVAGGLPCNRVARWNGLAWAPLGAGMNTWVRAFTVYDGQLVAGGEFGTAGGRASIGWARWGMAEPPVTITQWRSVRYHPGPVSSDLPIVLDPVVTTGAAITSEPRRFGVQRIEVDITGPAECGFELRDTVMAEQAGGGGFTYPADQQQLVWNGGNSYTLIAEWLGGLPDGRCYRIDLGGCLPCPGGDSDCLVRALAGDVNNDGKTDLIDMAQLKSMNGSPVLPDSIRLDVNIDGKIDLTDMALVKSLIGHSATCP